MPPDRPLVLGHRGAPAEAPENTLASFRLALEEGADGVELDVRRCATGEVVVHHDADTARTCGEPGLVRRLSLARLSELDAGSWKGPRFRGERIPLLADVLEALPRAVVNVELKSAGFPDLLLPAAVARVLQRAGATSRCVVSSFDLLLLAVFRAACPEVATGILFDMERGWRARELAATRWMGAQSVHPRSALVTPESARAWSERRLPIRAWTVDRPAEVERLCRLGVEALITNHPGPTRAVVERVSCR